MKTLKLNPEHLRVESFAASPRAETAPAGLVRGTNDTSDRCCGTTFTPLLG
jgi:hypothetical protein